MMKFTTIRFLLFGLSIPLTLAAGDNYEFTLKPNSNDYIQTRIVKMGGEDMSHVVLNYNCVHSVDSQGNRSEIRYERVTVEMTLPGGKKLHFETGNDSASTADPSFRMMMNGLDELMGKPVWLIFDDTGAVTSRAGFEQINQEIPGCQNMMGICSQVLLGADQTLKLDYLVLPGEAVSEGSTWSFVLDLPVGPGMNMSVPVNLTLAEVSNDVASVTGLIVLDPATMPTLPTGKVDSASGSLNYTFDLKNGRFLSRSSTMVMSMASGKGESSIIEMNDAVELAEKN